MPYIMDHPELPGQPITVETSAGVTVWETVGWKLAPEQDGSTAGDETTVYPSTDTFPSKSATPAPGDAGAEPATPQTGNVTKVQE